jgi:hypothetical protein
MQRRTVLSESTPSEKQDLKPSVGTTNGNGTKPSGTRKRRKKSSARWYHDVFQMTATDILILVAAASFMIVCGCIVGNKISESMGIAGDGMPNQNGERDGMTNAQREVGRGGEVDTSTDDGGVNKMPFNPTYKVLEAHPAAGDRSDRYALLRQSIDALLPHDPGRSLAFVQDLQQNSFTYTHHEMDHPNKDAVSSQGHYPQATYDIHDCPELPPTGYPYAWNLLDILNHWPADDPLPRPAIYQGLCVFDFQKDYQKAMTYRNNELPFVTINDPAVAKTAERWNMPGYMERLLSDGEHRCEFSENNHFMYHTAVKKNKPGKHGNKKIPEGWSPPTEMGWLNYPDWVKHANVTDDKLGPDQPHWYYRLIGCGIGMGNDGHCDRDASEYLFDELPFFQPKPGLYLVDHEAQMGIHCRFGMKGVIAENHFDGSRNSIAVFSGSRRYILTHPAECQNLALYPKGHPSARHSAVNWANPDLAEYPEFAQARANEVILQPGQVLYLPTEWFHFIVSLELNMQCNTRSGINRNYHDHIHQCGF